MAVKPASILPIPGDNSRMPFAQFLPVVRGEIDDCDHTAGPCYASRFGQCDGRVLREVEHLVEQYGIELLGSERNIREIALYKFDLFSRQVLQLGARDAQHFQAFVERHDAVGAVGEQFRHPARAGPDI